MHVPQPLRAVLRMIANQLDDTPINWAVTGSCSLALQGLPVDVHDIDLRTTAHDAYASNPSSEHTRNAQSRSQAPESYARILGRLR
jgi:hypothetical protein